MAKAKTQAAERTLSKDNKFKSNPRTMTREQFAYLEKHLDLFGDLGGIVYCVNQKAFVGGNQRSEIFDGCKIEFTEQLKTPASDKTVARGYVVKGDQKHGYREVAFTKDEFKIACVVANNDGGWFDYDVIANGDFEWNDGTVDSWDVDELDDEGFKIPADWGEDEQDETDYSDKNKEIDTEEFSDKMILKLELTDNEYSFVTGELAKKNVNKELALLEILGYVEE